MLLSICYIIYHICIIFSDSAAPFGAIFKVYDFTGAVLGMDFVAVALVMDLTGAVLGFTILP